MAIVARAEYLTWLGIAGSVTDHEDGLLAMVVPQIERSVKRFLGYSIEQPSTDYVHYLPRAGRGADEDPTIMYIDVHGDRVQTATVGGVSEYGQLQLPEIPVRSVTEIREDASAYGGQGPNDFPASSVLTAGTDYFIDYTESGLCMSGIVKRINAYWPTRARTVMATYMAGYTQDELTTGIACDIKLAVLTMIQRLFGRRGATTKGDIKSERLGDYSVEYLVEQARIIPFYVKRSLQPFVSYARFM
jgi:hypothetical protein